MIFLFFSLFLFAVEPIFVFPERGRIRKVYARGDVLFLLIREKQFAFLKMLSLKDGKEDILVSGNIEDFTPVHSDIIYLSKGKLISLKGSLNYPVGPSFSRVWYVGDGFLLKSEGPELVKYYLLHRKKMKEVFSFKKIFVSLKRGSLTFKITLSEPALAADRAFFYLCDSYQYSIKKISLSGKEVLRKKLGPAGKLSPFLGKFYGINRSFPVYGAEKIIPLKKRLIVLTNIWKKGKRRVDILDKMSLTLINSLWFDFPTSYFFASEKYIIYFNPLKKKLEVYWWTKI